MTSRLQRDLELTVESTNDSRVWANAMCRLALLAARQGESNQALRSIGKVRERFGNSLDAETAAWLMLAEGVLSFYSRGDLIASADRLRRSYGIASALCADSAKPTCAAWLAHLALNTRRFDDMITLLREALTLAAANDHQARGRASLVVADGFHYAGRFDLARPWYEKARLHATAEGDETSVSAMLHNVAAFRTANVRLADALGERLPIEAKRAAMEAASALAYDQAIGTRSLGEYLPHVNEQLLIVERNYGDAIRQLAGIDAAGLPARVHAVHYADHATCAYETGDSDLAKRLWISALDALEKVAMDPDDVAYVCCRLAALFARNGESQRAAGMQTRGAAAIAKHQELQLKLTSSLSALVTELAAT